MPEYNNLQAVAQRLIAGAGSTFTLRRYVDPSGAKPWEPNTGAVVDATTEHVIGVLLSLSAAQALGFTALMGELTRRVRQTLIIAPKAGVDVSQYHEVLTAAGASRILVCDRLSPDDSIVLLWVVGLGQ